MRILFFGTPDYTVRYLDEILREHTVCAVITTPDKKAGRGKHPKSPAPALWARTHGIPLLQPEKLGDPELLPRLTDLNADTGLIVAYGKIIPESLFALPANGCFNLHFSLLPAYRGASPIESALLNNDRETGVTLQRITAELDAGDILLSQTVPVPREYHFPELLQALITAGSGQIREGLQRIATGGIRLTPQDASRASYCGKIDAAARAIDWNSPRERVLGKIRALSGHRTAFSSLREIPHFFHRVALTDTVADGHPPGEITINGKDTLLVACQDGPLTILEIQRENGRKMDIRSFINGHTVKSGDCFSSAIPVRNT